MYFDPDEHDVQYGDTIDDEEDGLQGDDTQNDVSLTLYVCIIKEFFYFDDQCILCMTR